MRQFSFEIILFSVFLLEAVSSEYCDLKKYKQGNWKSNCSDDDFLPLCEEQRICHHVDLKTLSAGYFHQEKNETTICTFPRILAGEEGFVGCDQFRTHYPCRLNAAKPWPREFVCDNNTCNNCDPEQDLGEIGAGTGFKCQSKLSKYFCALPQVLLYDNISDCEGGEDLCFPSGSYSKLDEKCHRCPDGTIISSNTICDGKFDCPDLSDECRCAEKPSLCRTNFFDFSSSTPRCTIDQVQCDDGTCINRTDVCNGIPDCSDQSDESEKLCGLTLSCEDRKESNPENGCKCESACYIFAETVAANTTLQCLTIELKTVIKKVSCWTTEEEAAIGLNSSGTAPEGIACDGKVECKLNARDEKDCKNRFLCEGFHGQWISIPQEKVCDYEIDCGDGTDEIDCKDQRFYCDSGNGTSFVRTNQVRNGRIDCEDGSDECKEISNETNDYFFHSQSQLIENQFLYFLVWFMALIALTGNGVVIVRQITILLQLRRRISDLASLKANHILVLNLAIADFLMGIYLFSVGVTYERLKGSYCKDELLWRGSSTCTWMGVTALISCEVSVLTLVILTSCRLYAVLQPFKTCSRPKFWVIIFLVVTSWVLVCALAILPLTDVFRSFYPDTALLLENPFLDESVVDLTSGKKYLLESLVYYPFANQEKILEIANEIKSASTWDDLLSIYQYLPEQREKLEVVARYGYYNIHSICLADLFPRWSDPYSGLSLSLVIFNFLAFLYMAAVYVAIYFLSFKRISTTRDHSESTNMQGKIFRIIASNFLVWVPICILSFLRLANALSGNVYQVAAIVLLPINSSVNPILYSNIITSMFQKMCGYADDIKKRTIRLTSIDTTLSTARTLSLDRIKQ